MLSCDCINHLKTAAAFIFDMDGTLIDNMRFHDQSWAQLHRELGLVFDTERFTQVTAGRTGLEVLRAMVPGISDVEALRHSGRKDAIYRELYSERRRLLPGANAVLQWAARSGVRCGLATAAPTENIAFILDGLGIRALFQASANPDDGLRGKPEPDLFLHAARKLGVAPADCIVFEDSPLGVLAAERAGMSAIAVTTLLPAAAFAAHQNLLAAVPDFTLVAAAVGAPNDLG